MSLRTSILVCLTCFALIAAEPTGTITGRVLDPTAAVIVGAKVTVTNVNTGFKREATTQNDGGFVFPLTPVGFYSVEVEKNGFTRFEQRGVQVRTDEAASIPVGMQVG